MKVFFWIFLFISFYTYIGYGFVLYSLILVKRLFSKRKNITSTGYNLPTLTLVVAAYNEEDYIRQKIMNTFEVEYPQEKLSLLFITDGSSDATPDIIRSFPKINLMHDEERRGKIHAIHRAMQQVETEIVVFTDANTSLNKEALVNIARHYNDHAVGAVAGEKRVMQEEVADATAGEGFYWKYESALKRWDSELYSVVGAAGELFSIRTSLYVPVEADTILDDFMISLLIAAQGYRIIYEPNAFAQETSSANVREELKRKIRIAAGGIQAVLRLKPLLNPFRFPVLSFQYISHRVLRWTVTPFAMVLSLTLNVLIVFTNRNWLYELLLTGQLLFFSAAVLGWFLESKKIKIKALFVPFYFCLMNYAVIAGITRYFFGQQSAAWEKAKRKQFS